MSSSKAASETSSEYELAGAKDGIGPISAAIVPPGERSPFRETVSNHTFPTAWTITLKEVEAE
jgi:hypothetical protein